MYHVPGILSVGSFGVDVTRSIAYTQAAQGNFQFAGITIDWFGFILLVLMVIGIFCMLIGSTVVGASMIAISYLSTQHIENIRNLRKKSEENKLISNFGSVQQQFSPVAKELIVDTSEE